MYHVDLINDIASAFAIFQAIKAKLKDELGFLVILAIDAVAILIENWMKMS